MPNMWTKEALESMRAIGDPPVDALVADVLQHKPGAAGIGRVGYNHMLDLADAITYHAELALISDSRLSAQLAVYGQRSPQLAEYFHPVEAPDWVDEAKLAQASRIWQQDSILAIGVLYAASLPACYLMTRGVPALYDTAKLADHKYVFQRIYETGLMLEGVMAPGGITISRDVELNVDDKMAEVLNRLDPGGQWQWAGHRLRRMAGEDGTLSVDIEAARHAFEQANMAGRRFLWGPGYIAARKVRFLHASMRFMLLNPDLMRKAPEAPPDTSSMAPTSVSEGIAQQRGSWDTATLGVPINQEDLAFVLLTFGYLIPKGMKTWGREVSRADCEAFLHLWKVVGHVMGIREDLMTDNLDEAAALYEQILKKNGGASALGTSLTAAVMDFLRSYLPARLGIARTEPAQLIIDQLGPDLAQLIIAPDVYAASRAFWPRLVHGMLCKSIKSYFWVRQHVLMHVPMFSDAIGGLTSRASATIIDSWRDSFRRKPFYVPSQATAWVRERGVTPEFEAALGAWRQRVFNVFAAGVASLIAGGFSFVVAVTCFFLDMRAERRVTQWLAAGLFLLGSYLLNTTMQNTFKKRPVLDDRV